LSQAQNSGVPPAQDEAQGNEGVRQVFAEEVQAKDVEAGREDGQQKNGEKHEVDILPSSQIDENLGGPAADRVHTGGRW
jgi:hypothetical protein